MSYCFILTLLSLVLGEKVFDTANLHQTRILHHPILLFIKEASDDLNLKGEPIGGLVYRTYLAYLCRLLGRNYYFRLCHK